MFGEAEVACRHGAQLDKHVNQWLKSLWRGRDSRTIDHLVWSA